jgi:hypothetical protein
MQPASLYAASQFMYAASQFMYAASQFQTMLLETAFVLTCNMCVSFGVGSFVNPLFLM